MTPEELSKTNSPELPPGEGDAVSRPKRITATQWVIGLVVIAVVAFPFVRRIITGPGTPPAAPTALNQKAQGLLAQSFALYQAGKYEEAIVAAKALVVENPGVAEGWNNLAASNAGLGRWDEAIKNAQEALRIDPGNKLAAGNLAYAQKAKATGARPPEAAGPGTLAYFLNLSAADYQAGKFAECIEAASQGIKLSATSSEALNNRAACYGSMGMFDEEIRDAQEAIRLKPSNQLAQNNLAWATARRTARDAVREKK